MYKNNRFKRLSGVVLSMLLTLGVMVPVLAHSGRNMTDSSSYIDELYAALEKKGQKHIQGQRGKHDVGFTKERQSKHDVNFVERLKQFLVGVKNALLESKKEIVRGLCAATLIYKVYDYIQQPVDPLAGESEADRLRAQAEEDALFGNDNFREAIELLRNRRYENFSTYKRKLFIDWHPDKVRRYDDAAQIALYDRYFIKVRRETSIHEYQLKRSGNWDKAKVPGVSPRRDVPGVPDGLAAPRAEVPGVPAVPEGMPGVPGVAGGACEPDAMD